MDQSEGFIVFIIVFVILIIMGVVSAIKLICKNIPMPVTPDSKSSSLTF